MATNGGVHVTPKCPLAEYFRSLGPVGSIVDVDINVAARKVNLPKTSVHVEMSMLQTAGIIRYTKGGEPYRFSVRVLC